MPARARAGKAAPGLFAQGDVVETARLRLSAATREDIDAMPWLQDALAPDWDPEDLLPHIEAGEAALISTSDTRPIGLAVTMKRRPEGDAACLPFIGIDPRERFQGLGGEAALALERQSAKRWRTRRLLAAVPEQRGLAVYFWLRIGFRPLVDSEAPRPPAGINGKPRPGIWMVRDLAPAGPTAKSGGRRHRERGGPGAKAR